MNEHRNNLIDQAIDDALRRRLAPPDDETLSRLVRDAVANAAEAPPRVAGAIAPRRRLAVAASLVGALVGAWLFWEAVRPQPDPYGQPWRSVAQVYADTTPDFEPQWVCRNDEEFARSFRDQLGQTLLLTQADGVEALGLSVSNTISRHTLVLLARVHGDDVLVFVDRVEPDRGQAVEPESGLRLFDRRIGDLVLYELTPREQSALLELFYDPESS